MTHIVYRSTIIVFNLIQVQITHRITVRGTTCTVSTATLGSRQLACQIGCSSVNAIGSSTFSCTDFGVLDGWSTGEGTYYYNFVNTTYQPYFEAVYDALGLTIIIKLILMFNIIIGIPVVIGYDHLVTEIGSSESRVTSTAEKTQV